MKVWRRSCGGKAECKRRRRLLQNEWGSERRMTLDWQGKKALDWGRMRTLGWVGVMNMHSCFLWCQQSQMGLGVVCNPVED